MEQERIIAFGLLTRRDLDRLGPAFDRAFPLEDADDFNDLIQAIDEAERELDEAEPEAPKPAQ